MQNDISLEEVKKDTTLREERLQKMKNNIEALQLNMAKKKMTNKATISQPKSIEPITINEHPSFQSRNKSPVHYQHIQNQFGYNSTLFKNIQNDSQPIMNNGSAVSNFSSVSNINNILNNHLNFQKVENHVNMLPSKGKDNLLDDIDKILEKVQKSQKLPTKPLERILEQTETKPNKSNIQEQQLSSSKCSNIGQLSAKNKLQEYKMLIEKLDNFETGNKPNKKNDVQYKEEKVVPKIYHDRDLDEDIQSFRNHRKGPSNLTVNSQYPSSEHYSKIPPTPPNPKKNAPLNAVERQKKMLKESVQQYKKLETQSSHQILDRSEIDFQLSDDEDHHRPPPSSKVTNEKQTIIAAFLKEKKELLSQLSNIEAQLVRLQNQI